MTTSFVVEILTEGIDADDISEALLADGLEVERAAVVNPVELPGLPDAEAWRLA